MCPNFDELFGEYDMRLAAGGDPKYDADSGIVYKDFYHSGIRLFSSFVLP